MPFLFSVASEHFPRACGGGWGGGQRLALCGALDRCPVLGDGDSCRTGGAMTHTVATERSCGQRLIHVVRLLLLRCLCAARLRWWRLYELALAWNAPHD